MLLSDTGNACAATADGAANSLAVWAEAAIGRQVSRDALTGAAAVLTSMLAASPALLSSSATLALSRKLQLENLRRA